MAGEGQPVSITMIVVGVVVGVAKQTGIIDTIIKNNNILYKIRCLKEIFITPI